MGDCSNSVNKYIIVESSEQGSFSGLTVCGGSGISTDLITGCTIDGVQIEGATFQGDVITIPTIYTNLISGATYYGDGSNLDGVNDTYVTGGTLFNGNTLTLNYNNGGSSEPIDLSQIKFTGNTSGDCITDLYVSNIHSCSPLHINPNDEGKIFFGSTSGITIDVTNPSISIGGEDVSDNTSLQLWTNGPLQRAFRMRDKVTNSSFNMWTTTGSTGVNILKLDEDTFGSNIMTFTNEGNIGIGTDNPSSKLHVSGRGLFDGVSYPRLTLETSSSGLTAGDSTFRLVGSRNTGDNGQTLGVILAKNVNSNLDTSAIYLSQGVQTDDGMIRFYTRQTGGLLNEKFRITDNVNVYNDLNVTGKLNIGTIFSGSPEITLGLDSSGNVVTGITDTNTFVTGQTFNNSNYILTTTKNDGSVINTNLSVLASDIYVLSGEYNPSTGIVTYTNNSGNTFEVSGFTTGMTDSYTTSATLNGNTIEFDNNIQGSNLYNVDLTPLLSGKTNNSDFYTYTSDTQNQLDSKISYVDAQSNYVNVTGDTMTGQLNINDNLVVSDGITGDTVFTNILDFDTTYTGNTTVQGRMYWDVNNRTVSLGMSDEVSLQLGQETHYLIKNQSGITIQNGKVVRAAGTLGSSGRILGEYMIADGSIPQKFTLGVATEDILNGEDGAVTEFGKVRGIDTTGTPYGETWNDGDLLWVSPTTPGGLTNVQPSFPDLNIEIAIVIRAHTNGSIFVRPHRYPHFHDLQEASWVGGDEGDLEIMQWDGSISGFTLTSTPVLNSLSATTISGGTFYGDGSNLTGVVPPLSDGQIFVGDSGNTASAVDMTGDVNINNTGETTIQPDSVTYDKMQDVSQAAMLGNTSSSGGTVTEIPILEEWLPTGTATTLLEDTSNWDINGVYIGTTITGTFQSQKHYDSNYFFMAVDDNLWIRMIRG